MIEQSIHIIDGTFPVDSIKDMLIKFTVNQLFVIDPQHERSYFPLETHIKLGSNLPVMEIAQAIQREIIEFDKPYKLYFCLDTNSPIKMLAFMVLAVVNDAQSYSIMNPLLELPRIQIHDIGIQERLFLQILDGLGGTSDSLGIISEQCGWGEQNDPKGVQKASYVANKLRKLSLIKLDKKGRKVSVYLQPKAEVYTRLMRSIE